ncbi:helix-turn-helix domain-containing protein [Streptomyces sp. NPDC058457]|uniref:helix-turn-helix domain-containing protein n=1 Tax=Streptomyces sp. NPDC058457 TaxID=3346507 RepID=UPI0036557549
MGHHDVVPGDSGLPLFGTPVVDSPALSRAVARLHTAVVETAPRPVVEERLTAAVLALSRDAATRPARLPDRQSEADPTAMAQARSLLRERFAENIAADELARVAGCSRFALYRGFRTVYGFAPSDYQRDLRLRRTRALLAEGTAPSTAAAEAGFADQAHLTRWFTRTYGVTPAAYRTAPHGEFQQ